MPLLATRSVGIFSRPVTRRPSAMRTCGGRPRSWLQLQSATARRSATPSAAKLAASHGPSRA